MRNRGASPAFILPSIILIIAFVFITQLHTVLKLKLLTRRISLQVRHNREKTNFLEAAAELIDLIREEGPRKALQAYDQRKFNLIFIDISSRINLNWMDPSFIAFCAGMLSEEDRLLPIEEFARRRKELGFLCNFETRYSSFFGTEFCSKYCNSYNYINVNIISDALLRDYLCNEQGFLFAEKLLDAIAEAKEQEGVLINQSVYSLLEKEKRLWPLVSACPVFNVNSIPEELLLAILSYPDFAIAGPERKLEEIIELRSEHVLDCNELALLLGQSSEHPIFQYLGCKTWCYRLVIEKTREQQSSVSEISKAAFLITRIPSAHPLEEDSFELIGKKFIEWED